MHNGGDMQDMIAREMMKFENFEKEIIPFSLFFWDFFFLVNYAYFIILHISTVLLVHFSVKEFLSVSNSMYTGSFRLNTIIFS